MLLKLIQNQRIPKQNFIRNMSLIKQKAFVNNQWIDAKSQKTFPVINPADGEIIAQVPDMNGKDTEAAIDLASKAFSTWQNTTGHERSKLLQNWYQLIIENQQEIAKLMTKECGKPLAESLGEISYGNGYIEFYAEEAKRIMGEIIPSPFKNKKYLVEKYPIGVVGMLTAFNFPLAMISRKAAAALAAGCTCIVKPSTDAPLTALAIAELAKEAGFPEGVFNVITSSHENNPDCANVLCEHPSVRGMSLTGSTALGKIINTKCAPHVKRVALELGGNAPFIIYNSADLDIAVKGTLAGKFRNSGQTCVAPNRFFVQDGIFDTFVEKLVQQTKTLKIGNGLEPDVQIGPMIHSNHLNKIESLVQDAVNKGANVVLGGKRASNLGELFYEPTIITDVNSTMQMYNDEIFGPVISLIRFKTEEESIEMANCTDVGLAGYFFSTDLNQILRVSRAIKVGMIGVNEGVISAPEIPFGGVKQSGLGREGSHHGLDDYLDFKYICLGNLDYY